MRTGPSAAAMVGKPWENQTNELIKVEIGTFKKISGCIEAAYCNMAAD
jgi:hypothetical protein